MDAAGRQFDRRKSAKASGQSPGPDVGRTANHHTIPIGEHDVDGKPHEEGVHGAARRNEERFVIEAIPPEQPSTTGSGVDRRSQVGGQRRAGVGVDQPPGRVGLAKQRLQAHGQMIR